MVCQWKYELHYTCILQSLVLIYHVIVDNDKSNPTVIAVWEKLEVTFVQVHNGIKGNVSQ